ncbi:MAG TPA: hypothetical protein VGA68_11095, partial [Woeseiaceae bacterium]
MASFSPARRLARNHSSGALTMSRVSNLFVNSSLACLHFPMLASAADEPLPLYLQDRGSGIPTSLFG